MPGLLLLLLIIVPLIEIALFIELGGVFGVAGTLLLIVLTALLGMAAVRRQGLAVLAQVQQAQSLGQPPLAPAAHGLLIIIAGLLLVTPGFFTDGLGFLLLLAPVRRALLEAALGVLLPALFRGRQPSGGPAAGQRAERSDGPDVIEGDYRVHDDD